MMKRKFDELISYFNLKVSKMNIDRKYKMELLGMITAIGLGHEKEMPHWIPCSERLPEDNTVCLVTVDQYYIPSYVNQVDVIQTEMKMAMVQLPCWSKEDGEADG